MKKFLVPGMLCALAMAGSVVAPQIVSATETTPTTQSDALSKIEQLMKLIADLQAKLAAAKGEVQELMSDLSEGAQGDDVLKAQEILASDPSIFKVKPTGFFGPLTKEALMKFQERYGLEVTGQLNEATREALKELRKERKDGMVPPGLIKSDEMKDKIKARLQEKWGDCVWGEKFRASDCHKGKGDTEDDSDDDDDTPTTREEARAAIIDAKAAVDGLKDDIKQMKDDDEDQDVIDEAEDTLHEAARELNKARWALARGKYGDAFDTAENASDIISGDDEDDSSVSDDDDDDDSDDDN